MCADTFTWRTCVCLYTWFFLFVLFFHLFFHFCFSSFFKFHYEIFIAATLLLSLFSSTVFGVIFLCWFIWLLFFLLLSSIHPFIHSYKIANQIFYAKHILSSFKFMIPFSFFFQIASFYGLTRSIGWKIFTFYVLIRTTNSKSFYLKLVAAAIERKIDRLKSLHSRNYTAIDNSLDWSSDVKEKSKTKQFSVKIVHIRLRIFPFSRKFHTHEHIPKAEQEKKNASNSRVSGSSSTISSSSHFLILVQLKTESMEKCSTN